MKIVILAGGMGTRLWPLSRTEYPKQFLKIGEEKSLFQKTYQRSLSLVDPSQIFVITTQAYFHTVNEQIDFSQSHIICEPMQKNTGPALLYALKWMMDQWDVKKEETIFVVPSDHIIDSSPSFTESVKIAEEGAKNGSIVTFGIRPTYPETGYGYIQAGKSLSGSIRKVDRFVEKPNLETAQKYVASQDFYWNSGMFLFQIGTMLEEFETSSSEMAPFVDLGLSQFQEKFHELPEISIDYAVMEKTKKSVVLPLNIPWSDVGSWDRVYDFLPKDQNQNAKVGQIVDIDTKNSLIFGEERLIATIGLEDMLIVETSDAIFIGKKEESQRVKEMILHLKKLGIKEVSEHPTTNRPWGNFKVLDKSDRYKIKKIEVYAGQTLSLQFHHHRSEHWVVVKGTAKVTIGDKESFVHENESIYVPKGAIHRVHNPGKIPLEIIETQVGEYLGEDDIVRLEDIYGR